MEARQFTNRKGEKRFRPVVQNVGEIMDGDLGFCTRCGAEAYNIEPDARMRRCESCNQPGVYGLEELLMMGVLIVA